jgi:hypothetical protein
MVGAFGFPYFPSPNIFVGLFFRESWWGHCPWIIFSQIYLTFFMIYASRLRFYEPFFPMWSFVFVLCCFFSQPDVNITWITGHIHRSIVDKIDPTSEDVEMAKKIPYQLHWVTYFCEMWSEEFIYRSFNWSVKILLMNRDEDPPFF